MKKIWKYPLGNNPACIISIDIPKNAKLLTITIQHLQFMLWAEVEVNAAVVIRNFIIYATGEPFMSGEREKNAKYVGTVFHDELVWHVYDLGEVE